MASDSAGGSTASERGEDARPSLTGNHMASIQTDHEALRRDSGQAAVPPEVERPVRKHPARMSNIERHNEPVILFVTVCTKDRRPALANARVQSTLTTIWPRATQYRVGHYMIMPDHIHLFCSPSVLDPENVRRWVSYWKRLACLELNVQSGFWQRDEWDTQLRRAQDYEEKWEYVVQNPVRAGLVQRAEDWPYQGVIDELRW